MALVLLSQWKKYLDPLPLQLTGTGIFYLCLTTGVGAQADRLCVGDLQQKLESHLQQPELSRAQWGIAIQPLTDSQPIYQYQADRFFIPASNQKLITTAMALQELGPNFRFTTQVYQRDGGKKVQVISSGDPSFDVDDLTAIAKGLKDRGVTAIEELELVDTIAPQDYQRPSWEWDDLHYGYAPPVNGAILTGNQVILTLTPQNLGEPLTPTWSDPIAGAQWQIINQTETAVDPHQPPQVQQIFGQRQLVITGGLPPAGETRSITLAVADPQQYFLASLQQKLAEQGISVSTSIVSANTKAIAPAPLLALTSPPLWTLIKTVNQDSNNLYAEALLNAIQPPSQATDWQSYVERLGLATTTVRLRDGSGLSRQDLVTPQALVQLLINQTQKSTGTIYQQSLAVAGRSGTLERSFADTPLVGKMRGKTGTLTGVVSLTGYVENQQWGTVAFSFMVNNSDLGASVLREAMKQMVLWTAQVEKCQPSDQGR
ncbi:penicillin-binding protein 4 [Synechocystis sp. PCC 6803]|uniref:Penicillin-binding protein 4 n=1 Tax=Synechocystis sp. (strain ATCC 27184 / PCC 6803 / Kazusa) TaxID=1111708 RepID=Q55728_SYNY3|nr:MULTISPECIES: D-alanyl-D-alanine carboxypeptidase/D-alanyl-D-alanine-endopeptidase [unclassified Synechocystis]BAM54041.1 penicillin-binding protein 4 [Synechocystis sp. PCC 6803] [Bacillus subtilis BEST7613]AGF52661.1 penicillin-binding protein 4 [Synechocystis sp. PCC 6803]ALJ68584.1 cytochrome C3 [Synechocystis sp. PCC 6803]AVP90431.1 D-alanyl-D-alanine carboxypeptidase/D-alanyl-D-alanine-endopeptidase [Synechocystis sp. IPPAS B-1465]MBD2616829.1 D-alanyl-D-alanine carboxypeptidase/D-ala